MRKYELMYILNPSLDQEALKALNTKIHDLIETNGKVVEVDDWGLKTLAYEIEDHKEGYYVVLHFEAMPEAPKEIDRLLKIMEGVMRFIIVRQDEA